MGVNLKSIIPSKEIELVDLSGKKVAVDALNNLFQYLTIIRDRMTGEPLRDSKGRVTSHLSGIFYRTINWMEFGIRPVFCFDSNCSYAYKTAHVSTAFVSTGTPNESPSSWATAPLARPLREPFRTLQHGCRRHCVRVKVRATLDRFARIRQ